VIPDASRFPATSESVPAVCGFVRDACERLGLSADARFDIELAVEEAVVNIVDHAYGPARAGDVEVRVEATDEEVRITLTDWGSPFEADPSHLAVDVPLEGRAAGGMGVLLVHRLMDEVTRRTASAPGGPNMLTLVKRRGS
jgi:anti-sigma regulatory factor (Ser/Thr protein kinase)